VFVFEPPFPSDSKYKKEPVTGHDFIADFSGPKWFAALAGKHQPAIKKQV
jgi:hypothetical protein